LFTRRALENYRFTPLARALIGAERTIVYAFEQVSGRGAYNVFEGRKLLTLPIQGRIWSRSNDFLPLRIELAAQREDASLRRYEATVDYAMTPHGVLLPVSVVQRSWDGSVLVTENRFQYAPFRRFSSSAEIKFTEVPQP
jgi:hypothetical protein